MKAWLSKQRWHFIYGLVILCLLAGTTWQRVAMQEQTVLVKAQKADIKALAEHIVKDHMQMVQHMHEAHGRRQQQPNRF
jgi:hypothetical protein